MPALRGTGGNGGNIANEPGCINAFHACVTGPFRVRNLTHMRERGPARLALQTRDIQEMTMKTVVAALVALSVLTGVAGSASAATGDWVKDFWAQVENNSR
jgi:hypothetical protein